MSFLICSVTHSNFCYSLDSCFLICFLSIICLYIHFHFFSFLLLRLIIIHIIDFIIFSTIKNKVIDELFPLYWYLGKKIKIFFYFQNFNFSQKLHITYLKVPSVFIFLDDIFYSAIINQYSTILFLLYTVCPKSLETPR
jgi:hypothetical protein